MENIIIESVYHVIGFVISILIVFTVFYAGFDKILHYLTLREIRYVNRQIFDAIIKHSKIE